MTQIKDVLRRLGYTVTTSRLDSALKLWLALRVTLNLGNGVWPHEFMVRDYAIDPAWIPPFPIAAGGAYGGMLTVCRLEALVVTKQLVLQFDSHPCRPSKTYQSVANEETMRRILIKNVLYPRSKE